MSVADASSGSRASHEAPGDRGRPAPPPAPGVAALIEEACVRYAHRYAVVCDRAWLTYEEIDHRSDAFGRTLREALAHADADADADPDPDADARASASQDARANPGAIAGAVRDAGDGPAIVDAANATAAATAKASTKAHREPLIAVLLPRSVEHVIAVLGAIRADAAFILIDPDLAPARLQFILDDCQPALIVVPDQPHGHAVAAAHLPASRLLRFTSAHAAAHRQSTPELTASAQAAAPSKPARVAAHDPHRLAYVIYTSGTTGTPKGIAIEDRALAAQLRWIRDAFPATDADRVLYKASPMFDVAIWELLGTLVSGAQLVVGAPGLEHDLDRLVRVMASEAITVIDVTPSMLGPIVHHPEFDRCTRLRRVTCGGEPLSRALADAFHARSGADLFNLYGPAEATITASGALVVRGDARPFVPLGDPVPGMTLHLLDARLPPAPADATGVTDMTGVTGVTGVTDATDTTDAADTTGATHAVGRAATRATRTTGTTGTTAEIGDIGEIGIAGVQLARGYIGRADLTAASFMPNPFEPGTVLYRTGDLARRHADGALEYLRRADSQVKIRGHRIEVEEIEGVLAQHPAVQAAVVSARAQASGQTSLTAHLVLRDAPDRIDLIARIDRADRTDRTSDLTVAALRAWLAERLPATMIPAAYVSIDQLPRGTTGKLDRAAAAQMAGTRLPVGGEAIRSHSEIEATLVTLWAAQLGIEPAAVEGSFFDLGGNSLLAVGLLVEIVQRFQVSLDLRDLEANPTIPRMARRIVDARRIEVPFLPRRARVRSRAKSRYEPLSFEQQAALHLHEGPAQNLSLTIELGGPFSPDPARWAIAEILRRHSILRAGLADGRTRRLDLPDGVEVDFTAVDLGALTPAQRDAAIERDVRARVLEPFDLHHPPLFRACLYSSGPEQHLLQLVSHRLVCDDASLAIVLRDFSRYYFHRVDECPLPEPVEFQYPDYARWQRRLYPRAAVDRYVQHWRRALDGVPPALRLRDMAERPALKTYRRSSHAFDVDIETTRALAALAERCQTDASDIFLAAFLVGLGRWSGSDRPIVAFPTSGRRGRPEAEHVAGPFGRRVLLDVQLTPAVRFDAFAFQVRRRMLREFDAQAIPLDAVLDRLAMPRQAGQAPIAQIGFDVSVQRHRPRESAPLTLGRVCTEFFMDLDLMLTGTLHDEGADCQLKYDPDLFDPTSIAALARDYQRLLQIAAARGGTCDLRALLA